MSAIECVGASAAGNKQYSKLALPQQKQTIGRSAVAYVGEAATLACEISCCFLSWLPGLPRRLLGREAVALAADTTVYVVSELPPVLLGRAIDLCGALQQVQAGAVVQDPKGAACQAAHKTLDLLGGGFVKVAQVVAHSPALFPDALVKACKSSLSNASTPPASMADVERIVTEELGVLAISDVYSHFEEVPMASASIAQVHAATLCSGETCVVKVVRPNVRERLAADFAGLLLAARFIDLVLGEEVILKFISASVEAFVEELRDSILTETDLGVERQNMEVYRTWLASSAPLRRAKLSRSVRVPSTFNHACGNRVLTMERINGVLLAELYSPDGDSRSERIDWQPALTSALSVAALSILDGPALFHADLHSGNMMAVTGPNGDCQIAFIDFGCCGHLPRPLRNTLLMQASAFASVRPDVRQFTKGFAHALQLMDGLGPSEIDTDALAEDLKPVLAELQQLNPFRPGSNPRDAELHMAILRLQTVLCRHGVQLPREFTLLMKTGCFGALYFSMLDDDHRSLLVSKLILAGAAFVASNPRDARQILSPATLGAMVGALRANDRSLLLSTAAPQLSCAAATFIATAIPLLWAASQHFSSTV
eukprot:TRINITY_DN25464_c0_g1_i1.p1 TRINITY_DN25464_c0_g1~~TRINITY_DN25464_c0_g1_i1.p1  ORF type:complete len:599 (-),score=122.10 TRINITY_DN25464_c0_g1_i1:378-2174(-)